MAGDGRLRARHDAFVDAAHALFAEKGFEATSLSDVVKAAGGSLTTLYKLFGSKEGLLDAVVRRDRQSSECIVASVTALNLSPAKTLHELAHRLSVHLLEPAFMAMWRIVISRSIEDPAFGQKFYDELLENISARMDQIFLRMQTDGLPLTAPPALLTRIYFSIVVHEFQIEAISTAPSSSGSLDLEQRVDFFLRGAGIPSDHGAHGTGGTGDDSAAPLG